MSCGFGAARVAAAAAGVMTAGCDAAVVGAVTDWAGAPETRTAIGWLLSVTYFSFAGSKNEKTSGGMARLFSFGEITISNVFAPLMPTSSSCLKLEVGGYLCQPWSSCSSAAFT